MTLGNAVSLGDNNLNCVECDGQSVVYLQTEAAREVPDDFVNGPLCAECAGETVNDLVDYGFDYVLVSW